MSASTSSSPPPATCDYDWFNTNVWFQTRNGNDTETHYPVGAFMDAFPAPASPGLLLLHAAGNVFVRKLGTGAEPCW